MSINVFGTITTVTFFSIYYRWTDDPQLEGIIGYCAVSINICLYAAPLQTMKLVIHTKSSASLPITMCVVNLFNGVLWCMYAILTNDMFVFTPNSLGVAMCVVQVALAIKYRPTKETINEKKEAEVATKMKTTEKIVKVEEPLSRAKSEMALAVTTCTETVAIEFERSKSYRIVAPPQTLRTA
eukprot:jgi/Phyca11/16978/fgenesh1_pg.PHYCAscaffold_24_\